MTDAERDLLASVYLDGEATPQEVALVERDPELLARVETFRAVRDTVSAPAAGLGPSTAVKEQQLTAALGLYHSQPTSASQTTPSPSESDSTDSAVIDLTSRRRAQDAPEGSRRGERLSLLAAAAGAMVLLVGGVFVAAQVGGGSESDSAAIGLSTDDAAETVEPAADSDADDAAMDEAADDMAGASEAMLEETAEDAMEEGAVDSEAELSTGAGDNAVGADEPTASTQAAVGDAEQEFAEDAAETAEEDAPQAATTLPDIRRESLPDEGFFPQEPVVIYPVQPTGQDLVDDLTLAWRDPDSSLCGASYTHPDDALLIAYLPVEVTAGPDSQPQIQEALYFTFNNDVEVVLVVRDGCQPA